MEMEKRIDQIELTLSNHEQTILALKKAYEDQASINTEILTKLNKLLFIEEQSRDTFEHHRLICKQQFDNIYQKKSSLRSTVIDIINTHKADNMINASNKFSLVRNALDLFWKIAIIGGVVLMIANQFQLAG